MPHYLAKDYLNEHLRNNFQFLTQNLLITPNHLEFVSDYLHARKDRNKDNHEGLLKDLKKEEVDLCDVSSSDLQTALLVTPHTVEKQLENFSFQENNMCKNIIQIDSDSDCEFTSSFGSSVMGALDQEVYNSIVTSSLCSNELAKKKSNSIISDLLLEELADFSPDIRSTVLPIKSLAKCLKPVRVSDPFSSLEVGKFDSIESVLEARSLVECNNNEINFDKIVLVEDNNFLLLEENISKSSSDCDDDCFLKRTYSELIPENLDTYANMEDTGKLCKAFKFQNSHLEVMKCDNIPVQNEVKLERIPLEENTQILLESPCSDIGTSLCKNQKEIPDVCTKETISEGDMVVMSPCYTKRIKKRLRNEEKMFGDLLLMLLPDKELAKIDKDEVFMPRLANFSTAIMNERFEASLDWDPMSHAEVVMKSSSKSIVFQPGQKQKQNKIDHSKSFSKIDVERNEKGESILINWKLEENRLQSLQYITSYPKPLIGKDIPSINEHVQAPEGYHKVNFQDKQDVKIPKRRPLVSCNINQEKRTTSKKMPVTSTPYQSPLDSFMMLRTGRVQKYKERDRNRMTAVVPPVASVSAAKVRPIMQQDYSTSDSAVQEKAFYETKSHQTYNLQHTNGTTPSTSQPNEKVASKRIEKAPPTFNAIENVASASKYQKIQAVFENSSKTNRTMIIDIQLSKAFERIIKTIEEDSRSLLQFLKDSRCIEKDLRILSVSSDVTRFLVKEEWKKKTTGLSDGDTLRGILCLHALVQVVDLVMHCGIPTACAIIKSINHEYQSVLRNCLEPVRKKLATFHTRNQESKIIHPKLLEIEKLLTTWFLYDRSMKAIIIVPRYFQFVAPSIQLYLSDVKDLSVNLYPRQNASEENYIATFYNANVILAQESEDLQTCPWEYFQYVIQYEYNKESCWHELVYENNPTLRKFCSLSVVIGNLSETELVDAGVVTTDGESSPHTILCGGKITIDKELLVALESKRNVTVFVKNYSQLSLSSPYGYQPDILIDERTGINIFLLDIHANDADRIDEIYKTIISVSLKCCLFHIIFFYKDLSIPTEHHKIISNVAMLITKINAELTHVKCKLWYVYSYQQLSHVIQTQCDAAMACSKVWSKEQWCRRDWLCEDMTKHERFLMSYPFINSFCAQVMLLKSKSFRNLLSLSYEQLKSCYKQIPSYVLKAFHKANHVCSFSIIPPVMESPKEFSNIYNNTCLPVEDITENELENQLKNSNSFHSVVDTKISYPAQPAPEAIFPEINYNSCAMNEGIDFVQHASLPNYVRDEPETKLWNQSQFHHSSFHDRQMTSYPTNRTRQSTATSKRCDSEMQFPSDQQLFEMTASANSGCPQELPTKYNVQNQYQNFHTGQQSFHFFEGFDGHNSRTQVSNFENDVISKSPPQHDAYNQGCYSEKIAQAVDSSNNFAFEPNFLFDQPVNTGGFVNVENSKRKCQNQHRDKKTVLSTFCAKENIPPSRYISQQRQQQFPVQYEEKDSNRFVGVANSLERSFYNEVENQRGLNICHNVKPFRSQDDNSVKQRPRQAVKAFQRSHTPECALIKPHAFAQQTIHTPNRQSNYERNVKKSDELYTPDAIKKHAGAPTSVSLSNSKKRRLTYEKVPGARNGQTRLTFL